MKKFKIIFLGDQSVGKTSVIHRYMNDDFSEHDVSEEISLGVMYIGDDWR